MVIDPASFLTKPEGLPDLRRGLNCAAGEDRRRRLLLAPANSRSNDRRSSTTMISKHPARIQRCIHGRKEQRALFNSKELK
jgi:hypothetical protein